MEVKEINLQSVDDSEVREAFRIQQEALKALVAAVNQLLKDREEAA